MFVPWIDSPPLGAVSSERGYWKVGSGQPDDGGQLGYDLIWFDAEGNVVGERVVQAVPKVQITDVEYDTLITAWMEQGA